MKVVKIAFTFFTENIKTFFHNQVINVKRLFGVATPTQQGVTETKAQEPFPVKPNVKTLKHETNPSDTKKKLAEEKKVTPQALPSEEQWLEHYQSYMGQAQNAGLALYAVSSLYDKNWGIFGFGLNWLRNTTSLLAIPFIWTGRSIASPLNRLGQWTFNNSALLPLLPLVGATGYGEYKKADSNLPFRSKIWQATCKTLSPKLLTQAALFSSLALTHRWYGPKLGFTGDGSMSATSMHKIMTAVNLLVFSSLLGKMGYAEYRKLDNEKSQKPETKAYEELDKKHSTYSKIWLAARRTLSQSVVPLAFYGYMAYLSLQNTSKDQPFDPSGNFMMATAFAPLLATATKNAAEHAPALSVLTAYAVKCLGFATLAKTTAYDHTLLEINAGNLWGKGINYFSSRATRLIAG